MRSISTHLDLVAGQVEVDEVDKFPEPFHLHYVVVGKVEHPQGIHPRKPVHPHQLVVGERQLKNIQIRMSGGYKIITKNIVTVTTMAT